MAAKKSNPKDIKGKNNNAFYTKGAGNITGHMLPDRCHISHGIRHSAIASDPNLRAGFNRHDYDSKRPLDKLPTEHEDIILACQAIYKKIGMVRNIIDLMTDFAAEGLELQHSTKTQERFFRKWAKQVDLQGRAHDFMKLLMRDANVIIRRKTALISKPLAKDMTKGNIPGINNIYEKNVKDPPEKVKIPKRQTSIRQIPWRYTFLSPVVVVKIGGEVGRFFGDDSLGMKIPTSLSRSIKTPKTDAEKSFIKKLPPEVIQAAKKNINLVKLNMDNIYVDYYKKDDWEDWGTPFLFGVLEDILLKEKMRLADMSALDGYINVIRLWKLGKSDQQIFPAPALVDRLIDILQNNTGGGTMDLVWDDMIELQTEYPPIDKILGAEKYVAVNNDIVRGLGIPDSLIGGSDLGTRNAQSAFVQLKTLVERLEYVRSRAIRWMEGEFRLVADAMEFKNIPSISFGIMSLRDEAAEKQLIIQLLDRGIISSEKTTDMFGINYMIELERIKAEHNIRKDNPGILEKSNPYNRPFSVMEKQTELAIEIEKVKQGFNKNSDFPSPGNNNGGDNSLGDQPTNDGNNSPGRPASTKDTSPRDNRTPKTLSVLHVMGDSLLDNIHNLIDVPFLKQNNVKDMRSLTKSQRKKLERTKRGILSVILPGDTIDKKLIKQRLKTISQQDINMERCFINLVSDFTLSTQRTPNLREQRTLAALAWASIVS